MTVYVAGDIRGIQDYVFGSPRLLEMRGASALIDFFDRAAVPALLEPVGGRLIFSGGGNFLAALEGEDARERAERFMGDVRTAFLDLTGTSGLTVVRIESDAGFEKAQVDIFNRLREVKRSSSEVRALASMPFLKRCESCGRETADEPFRRPRGEEGERQWLGPICSRKRRMHNALQEARNDPKRSPARWGVYGVTGELPVPEVTETLSKAKLPSDFRELAGDEDLAIVAADGNGLGSWFEGQPEKEFSKLSARVDKTLRSALEVATKAAFPGDPEPALQVLICGGDDLVAALPASKALAFTSKLLSEFRVPLPGSSDEVAGMSGGLVFCRPGFPFLRAHALAVELLGRAKARCRADGLLHALDFHRVLGSHVQSLDAERQTVERRATDSWAWAYGAAGPYGPEELEALLGLSEKLRTLTTANQRGRLREILSPRDDGPESPLDEQWHVPRRVLDELEHWLTRQEEQPFKLPEDAGELLREENLQRSGEGPRTMRRFKLADALLLAEYGEV